MFLTIISYLSSKGTCVINALCTWDGFASTFWAIILGYVLVYDVYKTSQLYVKISVQVCQWTPNRIKPHCKNNTHTQSGLFLQWGSRESIARSKWDFTANFDIILKHKYFQYWLFVCHVWVWYVCMHILMAQCNSMPNSYWS